MTDEKQNETTETPKKKSIVKKLLKVLLILIVIFVVVVVIAVKVAINPLVKAGVEKGGSFALGVDVSLNSVSVAPIAGHVRLNSLLVGNPDGYEQENMLEMDDLEVKFKISELMGDPVRIQSVKMDGMRMVYEMKSLDSSNIQDIMDNLPKSEPSEEEPAPEEPAPEEGEGKQISIGLIEISGVEVNAIFPTTADKTTQITLKIDPIVLKNIGGENGTSNAKIAAEVLSAIMSGINKQLDSDEAKEAMKEAAKDAAKDTALDAIGDLFKKKDKK